MSVQCAAAPMQSFCLSAKFTPSLDFFVAAVAKFYLFHFVVVFVVVFAQGLCNRLSGPQINNSVRREKSGVGVEAS